MSVIKIGLAPNKAGFYDPKTNTYLTLENPIKEINIAHFKAEDLLGLCRGLYAKHPAIVLFKGEMPQEAIDLWKQKYERIISDKYKKRIEDVNAKAGNQSADQDNEIEEQQVKAQEDIQAQAIEMKNPENQVAENNQETQEAENREEENNEEGSQKTRTKRSRK